MIVTIDGPAGAGKSTTARELAARLGFEFLDTGAMYRVVTLVCLRREINLRDEAAVAAVAREVTMQFDGNRVLADGVEVTQEIRAPQVTDETKHIAANNTVRAHLVHLQRQIAAGRNIVTEGRDQGTVAFPNAECKLFMTAAPEQRALRRYQELQARGETIQFEEILAQQTRRDERDENREVGGLKSTADSILIDTSHLDRTGVIDLMEKTVREKLRLPGAVGLSLNASDISR